VTGHKIEHLSLFIDGEANISNFGFYAAPHSHGTRSDFLKSKQPQPKSNPLPPFNVEV